MLPLAAAAALAAERRDKAAARWSLDTAAGVAALPGLALLGVLRAAVCLLLLPPLPSAAGPGPTAGDLAGRGTARFCLLLPAAARRACFCLRLLCCSHSMPVSGVLPSFVNSPTDPSFAAACPTWLLVLVAGCVSSRRALLMVHCC